MANVSAQEQLMLELVNRARLDPFAEAARQGISLNQGLPAGTITGTAKQALAMNQNLQTAADNHSEYMHLNDSFSHTEVNGNIGFTGVTPGDRIFNAGYIGATSQGENLAWRPVVSNNLTTTITLQHGDLFKSTAGHRQNLLAENWREVGIGQDRGSFLSNNTQVDSSLVTQNFAYRGSQFFLTGVIYQDTVTNDDFYTVGEGQGNVLVSATGGNNDTSSTAGGYEIALGNGGYTVDIGGATVVIAIAGRNVKLDLVNGNQIWTDTSLTLVSGSADVRLLGITNANLVGTNSGEQLVGNRGNNVLVGNGGNDSLFGNEGNDTLIGGAGVDTVVGGTGNDIFDLGADNDSVSDVSGIDTIRSTVTRTLVSYATIENLILQGNNPINGTGNGLNNLIVGNSAVNWLNGGAGVDNLQGGLGNDIYFLGSENDTVVDTGGAADTILSDVSRNLSVYATIENLVLQGGNANINGFGNALNNGISGNNGNNALDGGAGQDNLNGQGGNDSYYLGAENDTVIDSSGTDAIFSTTNRSLLNYLAIENLLLQGAANASATGNNLSNGIIGNSGNNVMAGLGGTDTLIGGAGNDAIFGQADRDTLAGGIGNDGFYYQTASDSVAGPTCDIITDFDDLGNDFIDLQGVFGGMMNYVGTGPFSGALGEVRVNDIAGGDLIIEVNLSGNAAPEMQIYLQATTAAMIGIDDFLL